MNTIETILKKYTGAPVTESSKLIDDLGLDSFLIVYFLSEVEDAFGIDLGVSSFYEIVTVGDILDLVRQKKTL